MHPRLINAVYLFVGLALSPAIADAQTQPETQRVILKMRGDGVEPHPHGVFASYEALSDVKMMRLPAFGLVIVEAPADWDPDALIKALTKDPAVEYGILDTAVQAQAVRPDDLNTDPPFDQYGLEGVLPTDVDVNALRAWAYTTGSTEVVIAVLDSGVDYTHPDLADNLWVNQLEAQGMPGVDDDGSGYVDDIHGYDVSNSDGDPWDDNGHGTAVSGTAAAQGNNGSGTTGVAWNTSLMVVKVFDYEGNSTTSDAIRGLYYISTMKSQGVNIRAVNLSFAFDEPPSMAKRMMDPLIDTFMKRDILLIAAAGNEGKDLDAQSSTQLRSLASFQQDNIIGVAASSRQGIRSITSDYGRTSVDLAAPGRRIYSPRGRAGQFSDEQTRNAGILFDDAETGNVPSASGNWTRVTTYPGNSGLPSGSAWTNQIALNKTEVTLEYGPVDLTAFPTPRHHLLINFKIYYEYVPTDNITLKLQAKTTSSLVWYDVEVFDNEDNSFWQEFNIPVPSEFHGEAAVGFRFEIAVVPECHFICAPTPSTITANRMYIDDFGVGRAEAADFAFRRVSGTSFAAPFVTGAVALLASHRPDLNHLQIRDAILNTVQRTPHWAPLVASGGILDLAAALAAVTTPVLTITSTTTPASTTTATRQTLIEGVPTTLTVALTREPGADRDTPQDQVVVAISSGTPGVSVQPTTLRFTADNWHIAQPITVTAIRDGLAGDRRDTTLRFSVVPGLSDRAYHDAGTDINAKVLNTDPLIVHSVQLNPSIIMLGKRTTVTVQLNGPAPAPVAVTLTLTINTPAYSTEVAERIAVNTQSIAFNILPTPMIDTPVSAEMTLTAIRTDVGTPLDVPPLPSLRIVTGPLLRLRLRVFLEGALQ